MSVTCKPQSCKTTPSSIQTCTRLQFHSYWLLFMYFSTSSLRGYFLLSVSFPRFLFQIFLEHSFRFCILMILWAILVLFRYLLLNAVLNPTLPAFNCVLLFNKIEIKKVSVLEVFDLIFLWHVRPSGYHRNYPNYILHAQQTCSSLWYYKLCINIKNSVGKVFETSCKKS